MLSSENGRIYRFTVIKVRYKLYDRGITFHEYPTQHDILDRYQFWLPVGMFLALVVANYIVELTNNFSIQLQPVLTLADNGSMTHPAKFPIVVCKPPDAKPQTTR